MFQTPASIFVCGVQGRNTSGSPLRITTGSATCPPASITDLMNGMQSYSRRKGQ